MILHLLREVVARLLVGEVEPVLVHQHLLVLEPLLPRFLRHVLEDALAELAGIGREIEPLGLAPELDALDYARHVSSMRARSACSNHVPCRVVKTLHQIPAREPYLKSGFTELSSCLSGSSSPQTRCAVSTTSLSFRS